MSKNALNWFLCGLTTGSALAVVAASLAYAIITYGVSVDVIPAFGTAMAVGAVCYTLRRDTGGRGKAIFISRERKARLPGMPNCGHPAARMRHNVRNSFC